MVTFKELLS